MLLDKSQLISAEEIFEDCKQMQLESLYTPRSNTGSFYLLRVPMPRCEQTPKLVQRTEFISQVLGNEIVRLVQFKPLLKMLGVQGCTASKSGFNSFFKHRAIWLAHMPYRTWGMDFDSSASLKILQGVQVITSKDRSSERPTTQNGVQSVRLAQHAQDYQSIKNV